VIRVNGSEKPNGPALNTVVVRDPDITFFELGINAFLYGMLRRMK